MDSSNWAVVAVAIALILLERLSRVRRADLPVLRPFVATDVLFLAFGTVLATRLALWLLAGARDSLDAAGVSQVVTGDVPLWAASLLSLVLLDLGNYIAHRLLHQFEPLWELHKVHHSSRVLDWLATFRSHLLEQVFRRAVAVVALITLGMPIEAIAIGAALYVSWAMLGHSNVAVNLRFVQSVLVTPRLHHLHHVTSRCETNFGTVFTLWDRIGGTFDPRPHDDGAVIGCPGEVESYPQGFLNQLREPFVRLARRGTRTGPDRAERAAPPRDVRASRYERPPR
jgi:lathosterol oxidase